MRSLSGTKRFQAVRASLSVARLLAGVAALMFVLSVPSLAQSEDFDVYKVRIDGFWAYSSPSGNIQGSSDSGTVDLQKDLGFNSYSTFVGKIDWKFTRKNHFYFSAAPFDTSRQTILARTITF
jgi:hypothetical protein